MQSKYYLVGLAFLTILLVSNSVYGCSCGGGGAPCEEFGRSSAVFVGTVTGVRKAEPPRPRNREELEALRRADNDWTPSMTFTFSVELAFLGVDGPEVEVGTGSGGGDCGYEFASGKRYLVYAYRYAKGNRLATGICSRTKPYELADEDIKFLGTLPSLAAGVTIYGEIKRQLHSVKNGDAKTVGSVAMVITKLR